MRKRLLPLLVAATLGLGACSQFEELDNLEGIRHEAEYLVPLVDSRLTVQELVDGIEGDAELYVDSDGLLHLTYTGDVITQTASELFASINESLPPVIPVSSPRMGLPFSTPEGVEVDRVDLLAGQLIYYFESTSDQQVDVTITFPQVRRGQEVLRFRHTMPAYSGTGNPPAATNFLFPADLEGYSIISEQDSIYIEYEARDASGNDRPLSQFLVRVQDLVFTYAEGYLGNQVYSGGRDTIAIDFFDDWVRGDVYFEDPRITFNVENSFGVPTRSIVNLFNVITVDGEVLSLESPLIDEGVDFLYPGAGEVGAIKRTSFSFTRENSNVDLLLGAGPVAIDYDIDALTNPESDRSIRGFITDSSYYKVQVEVDLPLYGRAADFIALDTVDIDFSAYEEVDYAEFKLVADNHLPLNVDLQAYLLDDTGMVLDSLLESRQRVVGAAPVDGEGIAREPATTITFAPFSAERFGAVKNARRLALSAGFSTLEDGKRSVRVIDGQDVRVRIGVKLGVSSE